MAPAKINGRKKARPGYVLGQKAFEKISALEGVRLTPEMRRDLFEQSKKLAARQ